MSHLALLCLSVVLPSILHRALVVFLILFFIENQLLLLKLNCQKKQLKRKSLFIKINFSANTFTKYVICVKILNFLPKLF